MKFTPTEVAQSNFMEAMAEEGYIDTAVVLETNNARYIQKLLNKLCDAVGADAEAALAAEVERLRAAVQSALDDLCTAELSTDLIPIELRAIQTLRTALAQQKQEG
ncbi:hypothetical protein [Rhizobium leguminosarum]|uniref:hypothetical protein n=1 Tax=Rhizobium leguminosarum TaxID=384 RepID=UPI001C94458B|nr:hypothetical protein [Rhizobium leguminosarum]MBY5698440.1 hypothetical protein [Rhizobium leguminosarum]